VQRKGFPLKLKSVSDQGVFTGWAAVYNNVDLGGDVIQPGAFAKTLQSNPTVPVLWQHRVSEPVGTGRLSDGGKGLQIEGSLVLEDPLAQRALAHLRAQSVKGLSIGYDIIQADTASDGNRLLKELRVWEVSLATLPMNTAATITSVKALGDVLPLLSELTDVDLKDSQTLAQLVGISAQLARLFPDDGDDEAAAPAAAAARADAIALAQLKAIDNALRKLVP
jgi:HK97 family phage prohead protease